MDGRQVNDYEETGEGRTEGETDRRVVNSHITALLQRT